nr:endonuclease/exonuclease/phosphatase family protein [Methylobacterium sp. ZNC0032]
MTNAPARIKLAWWNTRLTPPKGKSLEGKDRELAVEIIVELLNQGTDLLCLGEVATSDIEQIADSIEDSYRIVDLSRSSTKSKFNIALIFRNERISASEHEFIISSYAESNYKIAVRYTCTIDSCLPVDIFIVHWASRLYRGEDTAEREHFGYSLRSEINARIKYSKNIIVIGDFNDEPYNRSMTKTLRASRDHSVARDSSDLLYNPFWKKMTSKDGYLRGSSQREQIGTYFFRSHKLHRWFIIDQILFSPNFVGNSEWHLVEESIESWKNEKLVDAVESSQSYIDHLPVIAEIERDIANG